jgi:hypothetical protein
VPAGQWPQPSASPRPPLSSRSPAHPADPKRGRRQRAHAVCGAAPGRIRHASLPLGAGPAGTLLPGTASSTAARPRAAVTSWTTGAPARSQDLRIQPGDLRGRAGALTRPPRADNPTRGRRPPARYRRRPGRAIQIRPPAGPAPPTIHAPALPAAVNVLARSTPRTQNRIICARSGQPLKRRLSTPIRRSDH